MTCSESIQSISSSGLSKRINTCVRERAATSNWPAAVGDMDSCYLREIQLWVIWTAASSKWLRKLTKSNLDRRALLILESNQEQTTVKQLV